MLAALSCILPVRLAAADQPAAPGAVVTCAECGMSTKVANRYTSRIVQGAGTSYFCDIGDLVVFIARTQPKEYAASVRDFKSGEWLDASTAFFVIDKKTFSTPMGWGIAAFRERAGATGTAMDFEALRKVLR